MTILRARDGEDHTAEPAYWGIWNRFIAELKAMEAAAQKK